MMDPMLAIFLVLCSILGAFVFLVIWRTLKYYKVIIVKDYTNPTARTSVYWVTPDKDKKELIFYKQRYNPLPAFRIPYLPLQNFVIYKNAVFAVRAVSEHPEDFNLVPISLPPLTKRDFEEYKKRLEDAVIKLRAFKMGSENAIRDIGFANPEAIKTTEILLKSQKEASVQLAKDLATKALNLQSFWARYPWLIPMMMLIFVVVIVNIIYWGAMQQMIGASSAEISKTAIAAIQKIQNATMWR